MNLDTVVPIVQPIFLAILAFLSAQLATWIRARVTNTRYQSALLRLSEIVVTTVADLEQTTVMALKAASEDGKLTDEEIDGLRADAIDAVLGHLPDLGKLASDLGISKEAIVKFISSKIEAAVLDLRRGLIQ